MDASLLAFFGFDEPSGPVAWNAVGGSPVMEVRGAVRVPGRIGRALAFCKPGDQAVLPWATPLSEATVSFWIRLDASVRGGVVLSLLNELRVTITDDRGEAVLGVTLGQRKN